MSNWIYDFTDDFNREDIGPDWTVESGDVSIENGTLKCRSVASRERAWVSLNETHEFEYIDFDWYSDHESNSGSDMRFKFLIDGELDVEASWSQFGYQVQWEVWQSAANFPVRLYRVNGATATAIGEFELPIVEGRNTWHNMIVTITESTIKIYHNGELKIEVEDDTYRGKRGLILGGREVFDRTVYYDNLKINKKAAPDAVDKKALQGAVNEALLLEENDFTENTWTVFAAALYAAEGVLADENATQEAVDTALANLVTSIEGLVYNSDKKLGQKIGVKFDGHLSFVDETQKTKVETIKGEWTSAGAYQSSDIQRARDRSTSTFWQTRSATHYVYIAVSDIEFIGIRVFKGSSYRPEGCVIEISDDGAEYVEARSGAFENATGWEDLLLAQPVQTNHVRLRFGFSSRLYLYEMRLLVMDYDNQIEHFLVSWQEPLYVGGPNINRQEKISRLQRHPEDTEKSLLITMGDLSRFHNASGEVTLSFDAGVGGLSGIGGNLESFSESFLPNGLQKKPDPHAPENINITPDVRLDFVRVVYKDEKTLQGSMIISANCSIDFIFVGVINP